MNCRINSEFASTVLMEPEKPSNCRDIKSNREFDVGLTLRKSLYCPS
jgi:hypothetical protein